MNRFRLIDEVSIYLLDRNNSMNIVRAGTLGKMTRNDWNVLHVPRPCFIAPNISTICMNHCTQTYGTSGTGELHRKHYDRKLLK